MHHGAFNLGRHFASRDPAHIQRWVQAQAAGRRAAPKCEAVARHSGERCCRVPVRGSKFCFSHRRGADAIETDHGKMLRNQKILSSTSSGVSRRRAEKSMARIRRWEIWRLWRDVDPRQPAVEFLQLTPEDENAVWDWLKSYHHIERNKPLPGGEHAPTARCRERIRVAAWRVLSMGDLATKEIIQKAHYRVIVAVKDDLAFWRRLENPDEPVKTRRRRRRLR